MDPLQLLKIFTNPKDAKQAKQYLDSSGITSIVRVDEEGEIGEGIQFGGRGMLLFVKRSDIDDAYKLLVSRHFV